MIVFCSLLTGKAAREASTMGAEKRAPPGMGSNPIKAAMAKVVVGIMMYVYVTKGMGPGNAPWPVAKKEE